MDDRKNALKTVTGQKQNCFLCCLFWYLSHLFPFCFFHFSPKDLNLAAAILALLSLTMMVMGSICIAMSLSKGVPFFLKPASFCFILSGGTSRCYIPCLHSSRPMAKSPPDHLVMCFYFNICTGVLVLLSVLIFHQSVLALLSSDHSIPLHHELSWSVACVGSAGAILILGGFLFIILSLPFSPWQKCLPPKNSAT